MASSGTIQLLLTFFLVRGSSANIIWFYEDLSGKIDPIPNFELAMEGYDVITANSFSVPDPGRRKQIFDPIFEDSGRTILHSFIEEITSDHHCDDKFATSSVSNLEQYNAQKTKGYQPFLDILHEEKHKVKVLNKSKGVEQIVEENVIFGRADCVTNTVTIAPFEKPIFTKKFENALIALHHASRTPNSRRSKKTAIAFFRSYGTHFKGSTKLGSKIIFWKQSENSDKQIESCITEVAEKIVSDMKGNKSATVKTFAAKSIDCGRTTHEKYLKFENDKTIPSEKMVITGEMPEKSLESWSARAQDSPVPVYFELMKISYLFRNDWLDFITFNSDPCYDKYTRGNCEPDDAESLFRFFDSSLQDYCEAIHGSDCTDGSIANYNGYTNDLHLQDIESSSSYISDPSDVAKPGAVELVLKNRGVVASGGFRDAKSGLSSVEVFTGQPPLMLPNLPRDMGGHSLTAVGDTLYNCGGSTPWSNSTNKHTCYALNINYAKLSWTFAFNLPSTVKSFHTTVVVESEIWLFDRGSNAIYVIDTKTYNAAQKKLPFTITNEMCTVKMSTLLLVIDTNSGEIHSLDLQTNSPESQKWLKSKYTLQMRYSPICIAINSKVYITGYEKLGLNSYFEVYNFYTKTVSNISSFMVPRVGYRLFELHGLVGAVGGMQRNSTTVLDSVETYNETADEWQLQRWKLRSPRVYFATAQFSGN